MRRPVAGSVRVGRTGFDDKWRFGIGSAAGGSSGGLDVVHGTHGTRGADSVDRADHTDHADRSSEFGCHRAIGRDGDRTHRPDSTGRAHCAEEHREREHQRR